MTSPIRPIRVVSWNVAGRRDIWPTLASIEADVLLLQEANGAKWPVDSSARVFTHDRDTWRIQNGYGAWTTTVVVLDPELVVEHRPLAVLGDAQSEGLQASHPGQFTVVTVKDRGPDLHLVSLYGIPDAKNSSTADITLHRALSDLTPLFRNRARLLIAGDLNTAHGYAIGRARRTQERYDSVFDRFEALGMELVGPFSDSRYGLDGCPCGGDGSCRHIQTFRGNGASAATPFQLDYAFATPGLVRSRDDYRIPKENRTWTHSDHQPVEIIVRS